MPTQEEDLQRKTQKRQERQQLADSVGKQVLTALGEPGDLLRLQVRHLWGHCFRVNVFVGHEPASARIAHSYFVLVDGEGSVIDSRPNVKRQY